MDRQTFIEQLSYVADLHAIISATDLAGNITYVNDNFCEITGYAREELLGKNHRILKSGIHGPAFYRKSAVKLRPLGRGYKACL